MKYPGIAILLAASTAHAVHAQTRVVVPADDARVKRALAQVAATEPRAIEDQVAICQIASPPFKEQRRAEDYRRRLTELGLQNVRIDSVGNVIAERRGSGVSGTSGGAGSGASAAGAVVVSGHLDTVFPEDTDVTVHREGTKLRGPGISDDCRGLAIVLAVARAFQQMQVQTTRTIYFVGTVGEEGAGNLRGVRNLLQKELKDDVAYFISIDSDSLGHVKDAVGSYRYSVTFKGPGGHSYEAFGMPNPMHAMGRAIARIADLQVTQSPKVTYSVGLASGGTSVNAIAPAASFEIDMRAETSEALQDLDARFRAAVEQGLRDENARWPASDVKLTVEYDRWGERPAGQQRADSYIIQATSAAARALGFTTSSHASSTDANMAIGMGIPAVTIGIGGTNDGGHSLSEWWDSTDSHRATQWAFLLVATLAGIR